MLQGLECHNTMGNEMTEDGSRYVLASTAQMLYFQAIIPTFIYMYGVYYSSKYIH